MLSKKKRRLSSKKRSFGVLNMGCLLSVFWVLVFVKVPLMYVGEDDLEEGDTFGPLRAFKIQIPVAE